MEFGFKKVCINTPFPTHQSGHIQQTYDVSEHRDDLYVRLAAFRDEGCWFISASCDLIDVYNDIKEEIETRVREELNNENIHVVTNATHTHYSHEPKDPKFRKFMIDGVVETIVNMKYEEKKDVTVSYERMKCQKYGKSRISDYETGLEILALIRFYSEKDNFLNIVVHNCHPTVLEATSPFFSAEYPGQVLRQLENSHPDTNFTFMQSCAGDISSRFVRTAKTYEEMLRMANEVYKDCEQLMSHDPERKDFRLDFNEIEIPVEHDFSPIDLSKIRTNLSDREMETIGYGQIVRAQMLESDELVKSEKIARIDFGRLSLVFTPNELFSAYLNEVNLDERLIIAYGNGQGPYVLPIGFTNITYEMFTDTMSVKTKQQLIEVIKNI